RPCAAGARRTVRRSRVGTSRRLPLGPPIGGVPERELDVLDGRHDGVEPIEQAGDVPPHVRRQPTGARALGEQVGLADGALELVAHPVDQRSELAQETLRSIRGRTDPGGGGVGGVLEVDQLPAPAREPTYDGCCAGQPSASAGACLAELAATPVRASTARRANSSTELAWIETSARLTASGIGSGARAAAGVVNSAARKAGSKKARPTTRSTGSIIGSATSGDQRAPGQPVLTGREGAVGAATGRIGFMLFLEWCVGIVGHR